MKKATMLTKAQIHTKYPEVYESYSLQEKCDEASYESKLKFWENVGIACYEVSLNPFTKVFLLNKIYIYSFFFLKRWTVPYFLEREKDKKKPCLRLNYPLEGKCDDCVRGNCRYDTVCFMCGEEGHGCFQTFPGGKLKGDFTILHDCL